MKAPSWLSQITTWRFSLVISAAYLLGLLILALPMIPGSQWQLLDLVPGYGLVATDQYTVQPSGADLSTATLARELQHRLGNTSLGISYFSVSYNDQQVTVNVPHDDNTAGTVRSTLSAQGSAYIAISDKRLDEVDQQQDIFHFYTATNYQPSIVDKKDFRRVYIRHDTSTDPARDYFVIELSTDGFNRFKSLNNDSNANKVIALQVDGQVLPIGVISATTFDTFTNNTIAAPLSFGLDASRYVISILEGQTLPSAVSVAGPTAIVPWFNFRSAWLLIVSFAALAIVTMLALAWRQRHQLYLALIGSLAVLHIPLATITLAKLTQRPVSVFDLVVILFSLVIILSLVGIIIWVDSRPKLSQRQKQWKLFNSQTLQFISIFLLIPTVVLLFGPNPIATIALSVAWQIAIVMLTWWWLQYLHQEHYETKR